MLAFSLWRDLCVAYVRVRSMRLGWSVEQVKRSASSSSVYVWLRCGASRACVRLSDHRPSKSNACRRSLFSVRQGATARLGDLDAFLAARAS
jgi:hypothetical protein